MQDLGSRVPESGFRSLGFRGKLRVDFGLSCSAYKNAMLIWSDCPCRGLPSSCVRALNRLES